jgi:hypothetical protein
MQNPNANDGPVKGALTSSVEIQHATVATGLAYDALVTAFERELSCWDSATGATLVGRKAAWSEVEREVDQPMAVDWTRSAIKQASGHLSTRCNRNRSAPSRERAIRPSHAGLLQSADAANAYDTDYKLWRSRRFRRPYHFSIIAEDSNDE